MQAAPCRLVKKQSDINALDHFAGQWEPIVVNHNHVEDALRIISKEARFELKELDLEPEFHSLGFFRRCNAYDTKRRRIILHSKFVYCKYLEVFEELPTDSNIFQLNGHSLEFTEFSYLHIVFRHYAQIIKQTAKPDKSYHNEDFTPNNIIPKLGNLIADIEQSGVYVGQDIKVLNFQYNGVDYRIYINQRNRSIRGVGSVPYWRIETFFPVEDPEFRADIIQNYVRMPINDILSVYTK